MNSTDGWAGLGVLLTCLALGACSSSGIGPTEVVGDSLGIRFEVSESSVGQGDAFLGTAHIENLTNRTLHLTSGCTRLTGVEVFYEDERVLFDGSLNGCGAAVTDFPIAPRSTLAREQELRAVLHNGEPIESGMYVVRLVFFATGLPEIEVPLEVR